VWSIPVQADDVGRWVAGDRRLDQFFVSDVLVVWIPAEEMDVAITPLLKGKKSRHYFSPQSPSDKVISVEIQWLREGYMIY